LLGTLEYGRRLRAPLSVGGEWTVEFASATAACPSAAAHWRQPALAIAQSGTTASITWNDGAGAAVPATIDGTVLAAPGLRADISGKPGQRSLDGTLQLAGCAPAAFHAVRQASSRKGGG
jgi:hypothetical protein